MAFNVSARAAAAFLSLCLLNGIAWLQEGADSTAPTLELQSTHVLKLENRPISFSFSRDGKRFASNDGQSARVWDTTSWEQVCCFTEKEQLVRLVTLSPDGRMLAFTSKAGIDIHLLDVASGKVVRTLTGHKRSAYAVFSPDGKTIASTAFDEGVKLWDVETGKDLERFPVKLEPYGGPPLVFSPDGGTIAATTKDGAVHLLDVKTGKIVQHLKPTDPALNFPLGLAFSPDGRFLALGTGFHNNVTVWDVRAGKPLWQLKWPVSRDPNDRRRDPAVVAPDPERPPGVFALAFTADSRSLLGTCLDRRIRVWEMSTGRLRYRVEEATDLLSVASGGALFGTAANTVDSRQIIIRDWRTCGAPARPLAPAPDPEKAWGDLGITDAAGAYQRMRELISTPHDTLTVLDKRIPTVESVKASVLDGLIRDLEDDRFEVRASAKRRLAELGEVAKAALSQALAKDPAVDARKHINELLDALEGTPSGDRLRLVRAVEVLECIGSAEARQILRRLAGGDPGALLTREAKAALERLHGD